MLAQDAAIGGWKAPDNPHDLHELMSNSVPETTSSPFLATPPQKPTGKPLPSTPSSRSGTTAKAGDRKRSSATLPPLTGSGRRTSSAVTRSFSTRPSKTSRTASVVGHSHKAATGKAASSRSSSAGSGRKKGSTAAARGRKKSPVAGAPKRSASTTSAKKSSRPGSASRASSISRAPTSKRSASVTGKKGKAAASAAGGKKKASTAGAAKKAPAGKKAGSGKGASSTARKASSTVRSRSASSSRAKSGRKHSAKRSTAATALMTTLSTMEEREMEARQALVVEAEMELESYTPLYNALVMEIVRSQVEQVNQHQKRLNETFAALRAQGLSVTDGGSMNAIMERLKEKLHSDAVEEVQRVHAENAMLREQLESKTLDLERKAADVEVLRNTVARKVARAEVDSESMRAEVHRVLQDATLDVEHMKKDLGHRIDMVTASLRTPKYNTALRSLQDHVVSVQEEIQEHRDTLSKLILSIGAKETFAKDESGTIHSNLPVKFRAELRNMEKDRLLNIMDVLSFQDGIVDTIGKTIYVLAESDHHTAVL